MGVEPVENVEGGGQDPATLRHLVEHSANVGALEASYRVQISGALELETLTVDALVPAQGTPTSVPADATAADVRAASARSGHLRILVENGSVVPKVVHVRDTLLEPDDRPARDLARPGFVLESGTTVHAALARQVARRDQPFRAPCVILSGGETTVTVRSSSGRGGRATEFLLGAAIALDGQPGVYLLAADTDGIDGIDDNAGAIVTPDTLARARAKGLNARDLLDGNDARTFFASLGDLVVSGPTFTNVNDFRALLVSR